MGKQQLLRDKPLMMSEAVSIIRSEQIIQVSESHLVSNKFKVSMYISFNNPYISANVYEIIHGYQERSKSIIYVGFLVFDGFGESHNASLASHDATAVNAS